MTQPFYERDYKYGSDRSIGRGPSGCPPLLSPVHPNMTEEEYRNAVRVCSGMGREYTALARSTEALMRQELGSLYPPMGFTPRSASYDFKQAEIDLIFATYFMQEFMPNGRAHPLYQAATKKTFGEFKAAMEAHCSAMQLAALSLE